jgi:hypothetical protein
MNSEPSPPPQRQISFFERIFPWLVLLGAWLVTVMVAKIAATSLANLGEPDPTLERTEVALTNQTRSFGFFNEENTLPTVSVGAIAAMCALGSLMVARQFKAPSSPRRLLKSKPTPEDTLEVGEKLEVDENSEMKIPKENL